MSFIEKATPGPGHGPLPMDRTELAQARTLAGWIALLAEERGLNDREVAAVTDLDIEEVRAILGGVVMVTPPSTALSTLDRALRRMEGRSNGPRRNVARTGSA